MTTSILEEELSQLDVQIGQVRKNREALEGELRIVEAELETFSADRQRFDALRDVCAALDKLAGLKADELFWAGVSDTQNVAGHVERARGRISVFEGEISGVLEKQASLQGQINQCLYELDSLQEEVRDAYEQEERRDEKQRAEDT